MFVHTLMRVTFRALRANGVEHRGHRIQGSCQENVMSTYQMSGVLQLHRESQTGQGSTLSGTGYSNTAQ